MDNSVLETEWKERLNEFETSCSKNFTTWCKEKDYSLHQAKYWRKKLQNCSNIEQESAQWLTFEINHSDKPDLITQYAPLLVKVGAAMIEVHPGYSSKLLQDVVKTLSSIC